MRIHVASDALPVDPLRDYATPTSNPFATSGGGPQAYAIGLRNPFRGNVDALTGAILVGDIRQGAVEEVGLIPFGETALLNFGWAQREGTLPYNGARMIHPSPRP